MGDFEVLAARPQTPMPHPHFDLWRTPDSDEIALLFFRTPAGYLLRFPDLADYAIAAANQPVTCTPAPGVPADLVANLYYNQVAPLIANSQGGLVLHGSAAAAGDCAIAFVAQSRRGKSTLAASFARAGYPFLTDDGLSLELAHARYLVKPNRPSLRLRPDSEAAVLNDGAAGADDETVWKNLIEAGPRLPFQHAPLPLRAIYLLGAGEDKPFAVQRLTPAAALAALIPHSFILDVEDRPRLRAHFGRLAELAEAVPCHSLDFPRRYDALPGVIAAIVEHALADRAEP